MKKKREGKRLWVGEDTTLVKQRKESAGPSRESVQESKMGGWEGSHSEGGGNRGGGWGEFFGCKAHQKKKKNKGKRKRESRGVPITEEILWGKQEKGGPGAWVGGQKTKSGTKRGNHVSKGKERSKTTTGKARAGTERTIRRKVITFSAETGQEGKVRPGERGRIIKIFPRGALCPLPKSQREAIDGETEKKTKPVRTSRGGGGPSLPFSHRQHCVVVRPMRRRPK